MSKEQGEYMEHITEAEPNARQYGDKQVLQCEDCTGCPKCIPKDTQGNQSKEYYSE